MLYGKSMVHQSALKLVQLHHLVQEELSPVDVDISVQCTYDVLMRLLALRVENCKVDVGYMVQLHQQQAKRPLLMEFLQHELRDLKTNFQQPSKPKDVVLFGFDRIGRLLARLLLEKTGSGRNLRIKAIVLPLPESDASPEEDLTRRANLLLFDSSQGKFPGYLTVRSVGGQHYIIANGNRIAVVYNEDPAHWDLLKYGIDDAILVHVTGAAQSRADLEKYLVVPGITNVVAATIDDFAKVPAQLTDAGTPSAVVTGAADLPHVVYGVNQEIIDTTKNGPIYGCSTRSANALCPILKLLGDAYGIESVHAELVQSYTKDQNLMDDFHPKRGRGRSAPFNITVSRSSCADAVALALPFLKDRVTAKAIRVPTASVSLAALRISLFVDATAESVNQTIKEASLQGPLSRQIGFLGGFPEVGSSDFIGSRQAGTVDAQQTVCDGKKLFLYVW
jgi:glyceraldehyde 3-phosphate dehydrogenase